MEEKLKTVESFFFSSWSGWAKQTQTSIVGGVEEPARGLKIRIIKIIICWFRKMLKIKFFFRCQMEIKFIGKKKKKFAFFGQSIKL